MRTMMKLGAAGVVGLLLAWGCWAEPPTRLTLAEAISRLRATYPALPEESFANLREATPDALWQGLQAQLYVTGDGQRYLVRDTRVWRTGQSMYGFLEPRMVSLDNRLVMVWQGELGSGIVRGVAILGLVEDDSLRLFLIAVGTDNVSLTMGAGGALWVTASENNIYDRGMPPKRGQLRLVQRDGKVVPEITWHPSLPPAAVAGSAPSELPPDRLAAP